MERGDRDGMYRVNSPGYALECVYYADRRAGILPGTRRGGLRLVLRD